MSAPRSLGDLIGSERTLVMAMQRLGFGRLEGLHIRTGKLLLDPWPKTTRGIKFGSVAWEPPQEKVDDFEIKRQVLELIDYIRCTDSGGIRCLEVKHGLPFSMEVEFWHSPERRSL
jgi:hypothetical protein